MQPAAFKKSFEPTLESMFRAKYAWLLRWAMHFAQNDAAAAEDLVQETFVRILLLKGTPVDLDNIEPLLYTHLRYAYLTERRRGRKYAFQSLSTAEFDTLSISLRSTASSDQIEIQNELRRILIYSLWRRRSAKFASVFLLRFFHEFTHEEIAAACLISRHAVDSALLRAREEIAQYLAHPDQIRIAGRGAPPEYRAVRYAVPSYDFAAQMSDLIFSSFTGICPDTFRRSAEYALLNLRALDTDQLAHLVSCKSCLERAMRDNESSPPGSNSDGPSMEAARRTGKPVAVKRTDESTLARIVAAGRRRVREIYAHRPAELILALNGENVAVRDISSPRCLLKVEAHRPDPLELVEVFSEQGVLMLLLPIADRPPHIPPCLNHEVALSGDRVLSVSVRFTADSALVEVSYCDPHYSPLTIEDLDAEPQPLAIFGEETPPTNAHTLLPSPPSPGSRRRRWLERLQPLVQVGVRLLAPALAMALVASLLVWIPMRSRDQHIEAANLLTTTIRSERKSLSTFGSGVVHQRVEIRTTGQTLRRDLYRDIEGRRHHPSATLNADERDLQARLAKADLDWDDPLSPTDFDGWRERVTPTSDHVETLSDGRLRLTTLAASGPVLQQTLTVRLRDLHVTARSATFRDRQTIEVAELSYDLEPWTTDTERLFSPSAGAVHTGPSNPTPNLSPPSLTQDQLDVARLSVLLAMQDLHAETERLDVSASPRGILVNGIVETDSRKLEIAQRLRSIPNVLVRVRSYSDAESHPEPVDDTQQTVRAISTVAAESPLDSFCAARRLPRERCRTVAQQILRSSADLARAELLLHQLSSAYPTSHPLTPRAQAMLDELSQAHLHHLDQSTQDLERALQTIDPELRLTPSPPAAGADLPSLVENNRTLTRELVYASDGQARPAQDIIQELADSTEKIHAVLPRVESLTANHPEH